MKDMKHLTILVVLVGLGTTVYSFTSHVEHERIYKKLVVIQELLETIKTNGKTSNTELHQ